MNDCIKRCERQRRIEDPLKQKRDQRGHKEEYRISEDQLMMRVLVLAGINVCIMVWWALTELNYTLAKVMLVIDAATIVWILIVKIEEDEE